MFRSRLFWALGVCALAGCASGSTGFVVGGGDGGTSTGPPSPVTLSIEGVSSPPLLKSVAPADGRRFVAIAVKLENASASAIPAGFLHFQLETDASLLLLPSAASPFSDEPCAVDTFVSPGASFSCTVVFETLLGQHPVELHYDDALGHVSEIAVSTTPPSACLLDRCWGSRRSTTSACATCLNYGCVQERTAEWNACGWTCFVRDGTPLEVGTQTCACFDSDPKVTPACKAAVAASAACASKCATVCDDANCPAP